MKTCILTGLLIFSFTGCNQSTDLNMGKNGTFVKEAPSCAVAKADIAELTNNLSDAKTAESKKMYNDQLSSAMIIYTIEGC